MTSINSHEINLSQHELSQDQSAMNTMPAYVATSNLKGSEVFWRCEFHKAWYKRRATQPTPVRTALMLKAIRAGIG